MHHPHNHIITDPRIVVVSETFPPDYSGAGLGAQFVANNLFKKDLLHTVITRTKNRLIDENSTLNLDKRFFFRIVFLQKFVIRFTDSKYLKFITLLIDIPLVIIKTTYFFFRYQRQVDLFLFVSTKWISLILSFWCVVYKKKYIIETTLLGHDDPIVNPLKKYIWFKKKIKNFQFNNATAITNISTLLANQCLRFGIPPEKVNVIPYSVDPLIFHPIDLLAKKNLQKKIIGTDSIFPIILFVGVLIKRKGIDIVYDTFKKLLPNYPEAMLIFAGPQGGPGQELFLEEIKKDIRNKGIDHQIMFTGSVENIEDYFNISDIFFFPSREEGFGRVFTEAMACNIPVVTKEIVGITDFIFGDSNNGIVVKSEQVDDFANAIKIVLGDSNLRQTLIINAQEKVKKEFSEKAVLNKYLTLFERVLETNSNIN